jgi:aminoglycoside phosphotransferase (APT) family kinase protein
VRRHLGGGRVYADLGALDRPFAGPRILSRQKENAMIETAQPDASKMPAELLSAVLQSLPSAEASAPVRVVHRTQHSNDFAEVHLRSGQALIVKRGRYEWAAERFRSSRMASELIREQMDFAVPTPLPMPIDLDERPVEAYWRINRPILQEIWPELDEDQRRLALQSWGGLISRLHRIQLKGFGPLADSGTETRTLETFLRKELEERLLPAVAGEWPAAHPSLQRLLRMVEVVAALAGHRSRLVHNDMHMGNVLCEVDEGTVRCVGLIDLETAMAAPPEADLAVMQLHHGGLFDHPIPGSWFDAVRSGYSSVVNDTCVAFFRGYHLINLGFHSALIGHEWHADRVAAALARETADLERLLVHHEPRKTILPGSRKERN